MAFDAKEFYRQQQTDVVEIQPTEPIVSIVPQQNNAVAEKTLAKDTEDLVKMGIKAAVINKFQNDENLIKKTDETAGKMIDNKLDQAKNETELDAKTAIFQNNVDACALIGVDEKNCSEVGYKRSKSYTGYSLCNMVGRWRNISRSCCIFRNEDKSSN